MLVLSSIFCQVREVVIAACTIISSQLANPTVKPGRWLETMKRTRVKELFLTQQGSPGHVWQIQQEINRLTNGINELTGKQLDWN